VTLNQDKVHTNILDFDR